jgi:NAD(P)-dependent dehydrogenase (short-subunit alcohol dehydrogenase family)
MSTSVGRSISSAKSFPTLPSLIQLVRMARGVLSSWLLHRLLLMGNQGKVIPAIFVSSKYPTESLADQVTVAYSASKGAIASLTLPLTRDLARYGIRVVTVAPSLFDSRMTAMMSDKVRASLTRVMEFPCMSNFKPA